jgi:hypothetical protein
LVAAGSFDAFVALLFSEDFMKYSLRHAATMVALMASAFAPGAHASDPHPRLADPADAIALVPPTRYESILPPSAAAVATASPAQNWKALNQVVGSYDSMALTMDMAPAAPAEAAPAVPATAAPAVPAAAPPATQPAVPDPHAGHRPKEVK